MNNPTLDKIKNFAVKELKNKYYANNMMSFDGKLYNKGDIIHTSKPIEGMRACY